MANLFLGLTLEQALNLQMAAQAVAVATTLGEELEHLGPQLPQPLQDEFIQTTVRYRRAIADDRETAIRWAQRDLSDLLARHDLPKWSDIVRQADTAWQASGETFATPAVTLDRPTTATGLALNVDSLTPESVAPLSDEEWLQLSTALMQRLEDLFDGAVRQLSTAENMTADELQNLYDVWNTKYKKYVSLFPRPIDQEMHWVICDLLTAAIQQATGLFAIITISIQELQKGRAWDQVQEDLADLVQHASKIPLVGKKGYSISSARKQVADNLVEWFRAYRAEERWDATTNEWVLKFSKTAQPNPKSTSAYIQFMWPPRPESLSVRIAMATVGWTMKRTEGNDSTFTLRLSFGANTL